MKPLVAPLRVRLYPVPAVESVIWDEPLDLTWAPDSELRAAEMSCLDRTGTLFPTATLIDALDREISIRLPETIAVAGNRMVLHDAVARHVTWAKQVRPCPCAPDASGRRCAKHEAYPLYPRGLCREGIRLASIPETPNADPLRPGKSEIGTIAGIRILASDAIDANGPGFFLDTTAFDKAIASLTLPSDMLVVSAAGANLAAGKLHEEYFRRVRRGGR